MKNIIEKALGEAKYALDMLIKNEAFLERLHQAAQAIGASLKAGGHLYTAGNGGSMCDAMHFAEELSGRFRQNRPPLPASAFSDPSHLTCVANDFGFNYVFSRAAEAYLREHDVLFLISTSGSSPNIVEAAKVGRHKKATVISLVGKENSTLEELSDITIVTKGHTPWSDRIQELHIKCIHILVECCEEILFKKEGASC